jgi:general secretion pathway protein K
MKRPFFRGYALQEKRQPGIVSVCGQRAADSSGVALVLVLWVMTLLTIISAEFCRSMRTETNISRNYRDATQSYYAAGGGVNMAFYHIRQSIDSPAAPPASSGEDSETLPIWRINAPLPPLTIGPAQVDVRIDNESGKVNINLAGEKMLNLLVSGFDLTDDEKSTIVDSILDWRDTDSLHRLNGAENDYYRSLADPYDCKNGDFDTVEELLKVRGVSPDIFHDHLRHVITVYPGRAFVQDAYGWSEGGKRPEGVYDFDRININAAGPETLRLLFGLDDDLIEAIDVFRETTDFRSNDQLLIEVGSDAFMEMASVLTYDLSPYYRIRARGTKTDSEAVRQVGAIVRVTTGPEGESRIVQWFDHVRP